MRVRASGSVVSGRRDAWVPLAVEHTRIGALPNQPGEYFRRVTSLELVCLARGQVFRRTINHIHTHATQLAACIQRIIIYPTGGVATNSSQVISARLQRASCVRVSVCLPSDFLSHNFILFHPPSLSRSFFVFLILPRQS